ncbi:hypothetical protein TrVE_jg4498 [Triparma verrucosa]|uniref:Alpha-galactosidase n=1 Tax=Triparma verrucosa TaxID=1606542 RepID=A0A9W7FFC2_9STRA|nr:hypothetical protein TrVE_jg4498 [Triparma verrucosa]
MRASCYTPLLLLSTLVLYLTPTEALDNGVVGPPPLGWSTWKTCGDASCTHDYCDEEEVKANALAMVNNGMLQLGYDYVLLNDCWASYRDPATNTLVHDGERFPSGMDGLADWLHNEGFKFGIYTSIGNETCSSGGRDITVPGSEGFFEIDAQTFSDWGIDYLKLDFCGNMKTPSYGLPRGKRYHEEFAQALLEAQATRENNGPPIFLEVVAGYWFARSDVGEIANSWRFCEDHHDDFQSTEEALLCLVDQSNEYIDVESSPGAWKYLDLSMVGGEGCSGSPSFTPHCPKQAFANYKLEFLTWTILQSPYIISTDVRNMTDIMTEALLHEEIVGLHQDVTCPPGTLLRHDKLHKQFLFGRTIGSECQEWLVVVANFSEDDREVSVSLKEDFGWDAADEEVVVTVRDVWEELNLGEVKSGDYEVKVEGGGAEMLRFTKTAYIS